MIKLRDLVNRKYVQKRCEAFEYEIHIENQPDCKYLFTRLPEPHDNVWKLLVIIPRDRDKDNFVYDIVYEVPRKDLPLETVAGIGLRLFQMKLQSEREWSTALDFEISEILKGMV